MKSLLANLGEFGKYAKVPSDTDLSDAKLDTTCSIRFQTTFLPVDGAEKAKMEFATEAYNYNTLSDKDPKNLILLCTTQGIA